MPVNGFHTRTCKQCRRRVTMNGGGICTSCLNGEVPPDDKKFGEPVTEEDTPIDYAFWKETQTAKYRHDQAKLERKRKGKPPLPSVRHLAEISESIFLEMES